MLRRANCSKFQAREGFKAKELPPSSASRTEGHWPIVEMKSGVVFEEYRRRSVFEDKLVPGHGERDEL